MAAVLKSPIAGLDDEQLAQISVNHRDVSFSQAALIEMEEDECLPGLQHYIISCMLLFRIRPSTGFCI